MARDKPAVIELQVEKLAQLFHTIAFAGHDTLADYGMSTAAPVNRPSRRSDNAVFASASA